jgi:hypothetical protein
MYRDGLGVKADGNVALFWLRRAADRGTRKPPMPSRDLTDGRKYRPIAWSLFNFLSELPSSDRQVQCIASVFVTPKVEAWLRTRSKP